MLIPGGKPAPAGPPIDLTYPTWDSFPAQFQLLMLIMREDGRPFTYGSATTDDGSVINMNFTIPYKDHTGEGRRIRVDAAETCWSLTNTSREVDVILKTTDTVATSGSDQAAQSFELSTDARKVAKYHDLTARWLGVKHIVEGSRGGDAFRGITFYLYDRGED